MEEGKPWEKKLRILTFLLLFSGTLNIALVTFFFSPKEGKKELRADQPLESFERAFGEMKALSFREKVAALTSKKKVASRFMKRDLALALLVSCDGFDLARALSGTLPKSSLLPLSDGQEVSFFPNLSDDAFQAIVRFAYEERWPLTPKGLFEAIRSKKHSHDESLFQALKATSEWTALQSLFNPTAFAQPEETLLHLIEEGSWSLFAPYVEQTKNIPLEEQREELLLSLFHSGSKQAARLLLECDFPLTSKQASALEKESIRNFLGEKLAPPLQAPPPFKSYVVQEGDSLWKIARQNRVKVNELIEINGLEKDQIFPGMVLKIP